MFAKLIRLAVLAAFVVLGVLLFVWGLAVAVGLFVVFALIWLFMRLTGKAPRIVRVRAPFGAQAGETSAHSAGRVFDAEAEPVSAQDDGATHQTAALTDRSDSDGRP